MYDEDFMRKVKAEIRNTLKEKRLKDLELLIELNQEHEQAFSRLNRREQLKYLVYMLVYNRSRWLASWLFGPWNIMKED